MKKVPYALFVPAAALIMAVSGFAQTDRPHLDNSSKTDSSVRTSRVIGGKVSNHASTNEGRQLAASDMPHNGVSDGLTTEGSKRKMGVAWGNVPILNSDPDGPAETVSTPAATGSVSLTKIYLVGVGDVLDIRLLNTPTRESTLFTVLPGGVVEYPLIDQPLAVEGLNAEDIAARLTRGIKVIDHPRIAVSIREHASHNVIVTGLVYNPGAKVLRQEAVPLYVVLAEAVARAGAARATVTRSNGQTTVVDLADQEASSMLLMNGDLVKVSSAPPALPQYFYVYGEINAPGEKAFRAGLTLTQSILASGGITQNANGKVKLTSLSAGKATAVEYNIKEIFEGRRPDPALKAGDRLDVIRGRW